MNISEDALMEEFKDQTTYESAMKDLKPEINNFLYPHVPGDMTIAEFEALSCKVMILIDAVWDGKNGA